MDMIGSKSGMLTILNFSHKGSIGTYWNAQCECGNVKKISTAEFNRGRTPVLSCGCYKPKRIIDLVGLRSGSLIVLSFSCQKKSKSYWNCKCDCGNQKVIVGESLTRKLTTSCGCLYISGSKIFMDRAKKRFFSKIKESSKECWEWQWNLTGDGYGSMSLPGLKIQRAHRASWLFHYGNLPSDKLVLHTCDNKICVNPAHLYLGTTQDNTRDAIERGHFPRGPNLKKGQPGERNCKAKLTEKQVNKIRKYHESWNMSNTAIAKKYKVNRSTIINLLKRKTWIHI